MHHVAEAEEFELRRSSRAQVSQTIAAVNDDRAPFIERVLRIMKQLWKRQMNRSADRDAAELVGWQHIDDLAAAADDADYFAMIDDSQ
jgi:hypothetical protein